MRTNLPTDLLRSFLAIVDTGSMVQAMNSIHLTQSAISLQIKKLEQLLGTALFSRNRRRLELTAAGAELAGFAREMLSLNDQAVALLGAGDERQRIRIGCVQDFADALLNKIFIEVFRGNPEIMAEVRVGTSAELIQLLGHEEMDLLMVMGNEVDGEIISQVPVLWYGERRLFEMATLPLALLENPCSIRDSILAELEKAKRAYRVVVETRSISALRAAVVSGIAVTARAALFMPDRAAITHEAAPALPPTCYRLLYRQALPKQTKPVIDMIRKAMADLSRIGPAIL